MQLLKKGSKGDEVKKWQKFLNSYDKANKLDVDGKFGPKTEAATQRFQLLHQLISDGIVGKWTVQEAMKYGFEKVTVFTRVIDTLVLHITASKNKDFEQIRKEHIAKGWKDVGYHMGVEIDGTVKKGRELNVIGAGVEGHNSNTVHLCYISRGNDIESNAKYGKYFEGGEVQMRAFEKAAAQLLYDLGLGVENMVGHNDYPTAGKACPCFKVQSSPELLANVSAELKRLEIEDEA